MSIRNIRKIRGLTSPCEIAADRVADRLEHRRGVERLCNERHGPELLCAVASLCCALLLVRSYLRTRLRLALFTCLCFAGLAVNNLLLLVDALLVTESDFAPVRSIVALLAMLVLVVGLVMEDA